MKIPSGYRAEAKRWECATCHEGFDIFHVAQCVRCHTQNCHGCLRYIGKNVPVTQSRAKIERVCAVCAGTAVVADDYVAVSYPLGAGELGVNGQDYCKLRVKGEVK